MTLKENIMSSALSSSSSTTNNNPDETIAPSINVDASEVEKFNNLASEWWSKTGAFATLHEMTKSYNKW